MVSSLQSSSPQPVFTLHEVIESYKGSPYPCLLVSKATQQILGVNCCALRQLKRNRSEEVEGHNIAEFKEVLSTAEASEVASSPERNITIVPLQRSNIDVYWLGSRLPSPLSTTLVSTDEEHPCRSVHDERPAPGRISPPYDRLECVRAHLEGNNPNVLKATVEGGVAGKGIKALRRINNQVTYAKDLELDNIFHFMERITSVSTAEKTLRDIFTSDEGMTRYLPRIYISADSLPFLSQPIITYWDKMRYILSHLICNAFQHGGEDVNVFLRFSFNSQTGQLDIDVNDNGHGFIDPNLQDALEGKTFCDDTGIERRRRGCTRPGLIFRICFLIAKNLVGGKLTGRTGESGTQFHLSVPVNSSEEERSTAHQLSVSCPAAPSESEYRSHEPSEPLPINRSVSAPSLLIGASRALGERTPSIPKGAVLAEATAEKSTSPSLEYIPLRSIFFHSAISPHVSGAMGAAAGSAASELLSCEARILCVDDVRIARMMLKRLLGRCGCVNIEDAESGSCAKAKVEEALKENNPYKIIFMDQHLGDALGNEVAKEIFALYEGSGKPYPIIIPSTSDCIPSSIQKYKDSGMSCECIVAKPLTFEGIKRIKERYFLPSEVLLLGVLT